MSLQERTIRRRLEALLKKYYQQGRIPFPVEVETGMRESMEEHPLGQPMLTLRPQKRREKFDLAAFNTQNREIREDLDLLYDELIGMVDDITRQIAMASSTMEVLDRQLTRVEEEIDDLLLTSKNAGSYLFSVFEGFRDLTKVDLSATDTTIDLDTGICTLRSQVLGTGRVNMTNDGQVAEPIIQVLEGTNVALRRQTAFSLAVDGLDGLSYQLGYTADAGPVTIRMDFPVPRQKGDIARISRLDLKPISQFEVRVLYSSETRSQENWLQFPGLEGWKTLNGETSYRFEGRPVTWIRMDMRMMSPTKEYAQAQENTQQIVQDTQPATTTDGNPPPTEPTAVQPTALTKEFLFGYEYIELYSYGYAQQSVLTTKPLQPRSAEFMSSVGKVTLDARERPLPPGTDIRYELQLNGDDGNWIPISPLHRRAQDAQMIVDFGGIQRSPRADNRVTTSPGSVSTIETRHAINYYQLTEPLLTPIFGTARVWAGIGSWKEVLEPTRSTLRVTDNYLLFTATDQEQEFYLTQTDERALIQLDTSDNFFLQTRQRILQQDSMPLTPVGAPASQFPLYSVERVLHKKVQDYENGNAAEIVRENVVAGVVDASKSVRFKLLLGKVITDPQSYIGQFIYLETGTETGYFEVVEADATSAQTILTVKDTKDKLGSASSVVWRLDTRDVTQYVQSVDKRKITLDTSNVTIVEDSVFLVTYRRVLNENERVQEGSVRVTAQNGSPAEEGLDFVVDYENKAIRRGSQALLNGKGGTTSAGVASFILQRTEYGLPTYVVYLRANQPFDITPSQLTLDVNIGESFSITGPKIDRISNTTNSAKWSFNGDMVCVVKSRPVERPDGTIDTESAIYKVINLQTTDGYYLFEHGRYFDEMYGEAEPAEQVSLTDLRSLPANTYGSFAISSAGVILNYNPATRTDFLTLFPGSSAKLNTVDYELEYSYVPSGASSVREVRLRAIFSRDPDIDASVTPVLESYSLRFS